MSGKKIVVMGVSGCGKSLVGEGLAKTLDVPFFDGDDFHSESNVQKMANGVPLDDADRAEWLDALVQLIRSQPHLVLACSALKRRYRDQLRSADPALTFVYLKGDFDTIWSRHANREGHYFNGRAMLESQFEQLEEPAPDEACAVDIREAPERVIAQCRQAIAQ